MISTAVLSARALKQLAKVPKHVAEKLLEWVDAVESLGLPEVRKIPGYHDKPLRGRRQGQRSIRLRTRAQIVFPPSGLCHLALECSETLRWKLPL